MSNQRQIKFGAVLKGAGGPGEHGAWKDPEIPGDASVNIDYYIEQAQAAERAKLDLIFIVDSVFITPDSPPHYLNRLEPFTLLSALATQTHNIGLVGTVSTSYDEPFSVARRFASLDLISRGRAGWNVVTTGDEGTAGLFGKEKHYDHRTRYERALEHVRLVQELWDTYEDDAFPRNEATGQFLNVDKLHTVKHIGKHFSVDGPLNIARSQQGHPVIFQAGDSEYGRDLGGAVGEGIFTRQPTIEAGQEFRRDIHFRAEQHGRDSGQVLILPGITITIGDSEKEARETERWFHEQDADFEKSLKQFGRSFGWHDFTQYDLDAPFPQLENLEDRSFKTRADHIRNVAEQDRLTLRQVIERFTTPKPSPFVGTAEQVANTLQEWFQAGAVDGYNVHYRTPRQFKRFADEVLPILRDRGLVRTEYDSGTLRGNLQLKKPINRHSE